MDAFISKLQLMTDDALKREVSRRRRARSANEIAPTERAQSNDIRQWYANLELRFGDNREAIVRAYERLQKKYHPAQHHGSEKRFRASTELMHGLTTALEGLLRSAPIEKDEDK